MTSLLFILTLGSILGCGLMAGVFFAFSTFIMRALSLLEPAQGLVVFFVFVEFSMAGKYDRQILRKTKS